MKIFVVTEISFEYNDEYYYQGENEGGEPVEAYPTEIAAKEAVKAKTREWLKEISNARYGGLTDYGHWGEVFNIDKFAHESDLEYSCVKEAFENYNEEEVNKMVLNNLDAAQRALYLTIFKVTEVELNETATTCKN